MKGKEDFFEKSPESFNPEFSAVAMISSCAIAHE